MIVQSGPKDLNLFGCAGYVPNKRLPMVGWQIRAVHIQAAGLCCVLSDQTGQLGYLAERLSAIRITFWKICCFQ